MGNKKWKELQVLVLIIVNLQKGVYVSRIDGNLITYDIRMTQPNVEPALKPEAAHTIEHIGQHYLEMENIKIK